MVERNSNKNNEMKTHKTNEKYPRKGNGFGEKIKGYIKNEIELAEKIRQKYLDI